MPNGSPDELLVNCRFYFEADNIADVSATSTDIEIEELELACEEFKRIQ